MRSGGAPGRATGDDHLALCRFSTGLIALNDDSHAGGSPNVVNCPRGFSQNCRTADCPANRPACQGSNATTNPLVRPLGCAVCAEIVVASINSLEARTAVLVGRSNHSSATMPCCEGHAPVASVATDDEGNVLARFRQSGNRAPPYKIRRRPPSISSPEIASSKSARNCSKTTSTSSLGRFAAFPTRVASQTAPGRPQEVPTANAHKKRVYHLDTRCYSVTLYTKPGRCFPVETGPS